MKIKEIDVTDVTENGLKGASGKIYRFSSTLNVDRFRRVQEMIVELEFGVTPESIYQRLNRAITVFDKKGPYSGMAELYKIQEQFYLSLTRGEVAMKLCALFLNTDEEDPTVATDEMIEAKVRDWRLYEYTGFFQLCTSIIPGFRECLEESVRSGLMSDKVTLRQAKDTSPS